nr:MAG: ribosomal protein S27E [Candidatus Nanosalinarum sp. J07AB56]
MPATFYRVECQECGSRQKIFSRPASEIDCNVCSETIAEPSGGQAELESELIEELAPE